jgi:hypothetical protein
MKVREFLEKRANPSQDQDLIKSYRKRKKLERDMTTAGSIGMVGSIPISILAKRPTTAAIGSGMAIGGALSYLGGMAAGASANNKRKKLQQRVMERRYNAQHRR